MESSAFRGPGRQDVAPANARGSSAAVSRAWDTVRDQLTASFPKIGPLMDTAKTEVAAGSKSPGTGELYETTARRVVDALGELRLRVVTVGRTDRLIAPPPNGTARCQPSGPRRS